MKYTNNLIYIHRVKAEVEFYVELLMVKWGMFKEWTLNGNFNCNKILVN